MTSRFEDDAVPAIFDQLDEEVDHLPVVGSGLHAEDIFAKGEGVSWA
jgi:hypothetical protein